MAKPIKETPVLKGKDAKKFSEDINRSKDNKLSAAEIAKMRENFSKLQAIAQS